MSLLGCGSQRRVSSCRLAESSWEHPRRQVPEALQPRSSLTALDVFLRSSRAHRPWLRLSCLL